MAIDNKVDAGSDDDPTSELAIIESGSMHFDAEAEVDASTCAFNDDSPQGRSVESLRSDLRSRNEHIGKLQFDAEQLRARWSGLEKEITAREELTRILQHDLRAVNKERAAQKKLLKQQEREIGSLNSRLTELEQSASPDSSKDVTENAETNFESAATGDSGASTLQKRLDRASLMVSDLKTYIDGRQQDWDRLGSDIEQYKISLGSKDAAVTDLQVEIANNKQAFDSAETKIDKLTSSLEKEQAKSAKLRKKNHALTREIDNYQTDAQFNVEHRLAEQSGRLVSNEDEILELRKRIVQSEKYADGLRNRLSILDISSTENDTERQQLDVSLRDTTGRLRELKEQLDAERLLRADLESANADLKIDFEKEVKLIRFELGTAQKTIGDYESVNAELASNVINNNHFRQALEEQLNEAEGKHSAETSQLEKRNQWLERQLEDRERKIATKDAAITALLSELASKSQAIESISEIGSVIHEIDDRMSERSEDRSSQDRDRPTRLLIGRIDGQELQFPLFKERLTIGRTQQNDIQLNAQYISRRHAVILCDEDGPRIIDWGSKNGVAVNGVKISEQRLRHGDKVTIGTAEFVFEERQRR
ncbi:MAG: FHA domain-containing protein [Proteobacteria bacterium]|nr:FHA domain-containing protein [Pseudomonadota bacterium]